MPNLFAQAENLEKVLTHFWEQTKVNHPEWTEEDFEYAQKSTKVKVFSFPQVWGSTALGFNGIGGDALTEAQTTVLTTGNTAAVYFSSRFAYCVQPINSAFWTDLRCLSMASVAEAKERY